MPAGADRAFLLWHDAAQSGDWERLLSMPMDTDVEIALWLLQESPLYHPSDPLPSSVVPPKEKSWVDEHMGW